MTDPFLRAALIGVARDPEGARQTGTAVDTLLQPDHSYLLRAGARDLYLRAGLRPQRRDVSVDHAPPEVLRRCSAVLTDVLTEVVQENDAELLRAVAGMLRDAQFHVPHALLPHVLGTRDRQVRTALAPILGERGRWLARRNEAWSWALQTTSAIDAAAQWDEGNEQQQLDALRAMRDADPAAARERLVARLPKEKAEQRAAMLEALIPTLSLDDEPLLERALDDRSANVKAVAADLLARLPGSAFVQRMQARAEAAVRVERKFLGQKLVVEPPAELDAAATRDILPSRTPPGVGARAYALTQLVGAVPLSHWTLAPQQMLDAAAKTDWQSALVDGWVLAAIRQRDIAWARALIAVTTISGDIVELARVLPPEEVMQRLRGGHDHWPLPELLALLPRPWPRAFSADWLQRLRDAAASGERLHLSETLSLTAHAIPPELFASAVADWGIPAEGWWAREWERKLHKLRQIIRVRRTIAEESRA